MAYFLLEQTSEREAVRLIRQKYHVSTEQARADLGSLRGQLDELVRPDGACPIHELGLETVMPFFGASHRSIPPGPGPDLSL